MDVLNNREIAILTWTGALACWGLSKRPIRTSLLGVLRAFLARHILVAVLGIAMYVWLQLCVLRDLGLWDSSQLKNTLLWAVAVAFVSLFRITSAENFGHYFKENVQDNLNLIVALEFVIAFYTFSLLTELLLVPLATLIVALMAFTETDAKYKLLARYLETIASVLGLLLVGYAGYKLATEFGDFARQETLTDFYLPPVLSLSFLPFSYILMVSMRYEKAFLRLGFHIKEPKLLRAAKRLAILRFHLNLKQLERWVHSPVFLHVQNKADLRASIEGIELARMRESEALAIPPSWGWSPYTAQAFLEPLGLVTGNYHTMGNDEWGAQSPYLEIGEGILANNVAYYISGDELVVKRLEVTLNVNQPESSKAAHLQLLEIVRVLYRDALAETLPSDLAQAVLAGMDNDREVRNKTILLRRIEWPNRGYEIKFEIVSI